MISLSLQETPRIPIGGRGRSGFGSQLGDVKGFLELTAPKVVTIRTGGFRPHLVARQRRTFTQLLYAYSKLANTRRRLEPMARADVPRPAFFRS